MVLRPRVSRGVRPPRPPPTPLRVCVFPSLGLPLLPVALFFPCSTVPRPKGSRARPVNAARAMQWVPPAPTARVPRTPLPYPILPISPVTWKIYTVFSNTPRKKYHMAFSIFFLLLPPFFKNQQKPKIDQITFRIGLWGGWGGAREAFLLKRKRGGQRRTRRERAGASERRP